ncbi:DNA-directed RNA polymerase iii subunit rpc2-like protein, partial [Trifolium pratense]
EETTLHFRSSTQSNTFAHSTMDKESPKAPSVDKFQLVPEFLKVRGLVKQHLDSFNYFVRTDIKKIVRANDRIQATRYPHLYLRFLDVKVGEPSLITDGSVETISPQTCRLSDTTYAAPIYADIEYTQGSPDNLNKVPKVVDRS